MAMTGVQAQVRQAENGDLPVITATLADAFQLEPMARWVLPDDSSYTLGVSCYFRAIIANLYLPYGEVLMYGEHGAALWLPPSVTADRMPLSGLIKVLWPVLRYGGVGAVQRLFRASAFQEPHHPTVPHYYLYALGVRAAMRRQGIGSALVAHVTETCDQLGVPAYLENADPDNLPFYTQHGFQVTHQAPLPDNGPMMWFMVRPPATR